MFHQKGRPDIFKSKDEKQLKNDLFANLEKFITLVILVDEKVVGYLAYTIKDKHTKKLYVDQLVILEKYRNQGLGKKMMDEVKNIALKDNCDSLELDCWTFNENAMEMYEHLGFKRQRIIYDKSLNSKENKK